MGELKSAWEIAQEKANKLGKLSAEEEQGEREQRCEETGKAIAQRYLDSSEGENIELNNYPKEERELIRQAILKHLVEAMNLKNLALLERAVQGVAEIEPEVKPSSEQISQVAQEYREAEGRKRREMESKERETLHQLRISGSAISHINIEAKQEWQQSLQQLVQPFQERLDALKGGLCQT